MKPPMVTAAAYPAEVHAVVATLLVLLLVASLVAAWRRRRRGVSPALRTQSTSQTTMPFAVDPAHPKALQLLVGTDSSDDDGDGCKLSKGRVGSIIPLSPVSYVKSPATFQPRRSMSPAPQAASDDAV